MAKKKKQNKESSEIIDSEIADAIIELPFPFYVGDERFFIYPMTLGKTFLLERAMRGLNINKMLLNGSPYLETLRVSYEYKKEVAKVIAYHTFKDKEDLIDIYKISKRADFFSDNLDEDGLAKLFMLANAPDKFPEHSKYLGITEEREWLSKAMKAKKDSDSMTFGGKTIYGTLIDFACERYGWEYDYVIWGISYYNLQMLMSDVVNTVYLSKEERKNVHIPKDRTKISGDDPKNKELLKQLLS